MLFDSNLNRLFIFAGKQESEYLSDMWEYDLNAREARKVFSNFTVSGGPEACFAHRAVVDAEMKEMLGNYADGQIEFYKAVSSFVVTAPLDS